MNIIDISRDILTAPVYEGDPEPKIKQFLSIDNGDECNLSALYICLHNGTHADAKSHFLNDGLTIDQMPLDAFIGPCVVMEFSGEVITGETVEKYIPDDCERLLIKSNSKVALHESAVYELADKGVKLI
nr:cyclase family protein [Clostridiales bacterium]